jgi:fumarate hydratase class II
LEVNKTVATGMVEKSLMTITALAPEIGYDQAAKAAKAAFETGQTVREYVLQHQLVEKDRLDELLDARAMTEPA